MQGESDSKCLVSDLFDVNVSSTVEDMSTKTEIRVPWGSGIVGHVAASAKKVNIADCYADERFNPVSVINSMSVRLYSINKILTFELLVSFQKINDLATSFSRKFLLCFSQKKQ